MKIKNLKLKISSRGITLVEVMAVIFMIALFFLILIADFPGIKRQFALSRASHKLAQDFRLVEDRALSGVQVQEELEVNGYGISIDLANNKEYILYADINNDYQYSPGEDIIIETVDLAQDEPGVFIKEIINAQGTAVSVNFSPPNPRVAITTLQEGQTYVEVVLGLDADSETEKSVSVNTAGLIEVK